MCSLLSDPTAFYDELVGEVYKSLGGKSISNVSIPNTPGLKLWFVSSGLDHQHLLCLTELVSKTIEAIRASSSLWMDRSMQCEKFRKLIEGISDGAPDLDLRKVSHGFEVGNSFISKGLTSIVYTYSYYNLIFCCRWSVGSVGTNTYRWKCDRDCLQLSVHGLWYLSQWCALP